MTSGGNDIVDLLRQRERELTHELMRIRTALVALGGSPGTRASKSGAKSGATSVKTPASSRARRAALGGGTVLERIEDALRQAMRPVKVQDLARLIGGSYSTLSTTLRRGKDDGRLINVGFGSWSVPGLETGDAPKAKRVAAKKAAAKKKAKKPATSTST